MLALRLVYPKKLNGLNAGVGAGAGAGFAGGTIPSGAKSPEFTGAGAGAGAGRKKSLITRSKIGV